MQRSTYPTGETTSSRIKSLVLYLRRERGMPEADALLTALKLSLEDLENETRPIGVALWHVATQIFAERYGRDALLATWPGVIDPSNLGVWMRVLRGATRPLDAFRQLSGLGGEELRPPGWQTVSDEPGRWHGRLSLDHDPRFEVDGLLTLARAAELRAIPVMFGLPPAEVSVLSTERGTFASGAAAAGQEYLVTWRHPSPTRAVPLGAAAGAAAGASAGLLTPWAGAVGLLAGLAFGAGSAALLAREAQQRTAARSQGFRLQSLERSVLLRDEQARSQSAAREGTVIAGLYRLGARLGVGASGVIHRAVRLSDGVPVAIKLLRPAVAHDAVASDRLRREAEAMGLAWHPNVVELFDQGALPDGTTYLVMELLEGETLAARLRQRGLLPPGEVLPIAIELCDALGAVHAAGVIHRDVKPGNVFLSRVSPTDPAEPPRERVKLLDFGIARVEWAETRLTKAGNSVGTPGYMSPEQEQGREIDARSDLFALGALLYECLTGLSLEPGAQPPSPGEPPGVDEALARASGVQRALAEAPLGWLDIIEKAMAPRARDRYADAKAMRDALLAILRGSLSGEREKARPPPPSSLPEKAGG